jgi:flavin-dependent thymidylate synthase
VNNDYHVVMSDRRRAYFASRTEDDRRRTGLTKDIAFNRKSFEPDGERITNPSANARLEVGTDGIRVELVQGIDEDALRRTLSYAINATLGIDPEDPPDEADWEEMLQGGLQTALETQVICFGVYGASRTCTHQLVRSRRAAFHQQSQRAHFYGHQPEARIPESVWANPRARQAFIDAYAAAHNAYRVACDEDISYQDARFALPEGTTNYILLEYPIREFLNVYAYRACSMFQWEISHIMRQCRAALIEAHPFMEPYVKISCEKTHGNVDGMQEEFRDEEGVLHVNGPEAVAHTCTFQGWEEVDEQCDFPWARETNRQFRSERHAIKKEG